MILTEVHNKKVIKIKKKYGFEGQFDLLGRLNYLPKAIITITEGSSLHLRNAYISKQLMRLKRTVFDLRDSLCVLPPQIKKTINQTKDELTKHAYDGIENINHDWQLGNFERDLDILWTICFWALIKTPIDRGGRKKTSIPKFIILLLAKFYHEGTGRYPTCGWVDSGDDISSGRHTSDFYEFVLDVTTLLNVLKIELGTNSTIGTNCTKSIREYRQMLQEN